MSEQTNETPVTSTSVLNLAIESVMDLIDAIGLFATIYRGALGTGNGLCCEIGPTSPEAVFLDKHQYIPVDLTINGKHDDLRTLSDALNTIHETLTMAFSYPSGNGWQIVDITTMSEPQVIAREDSGQWMMASALSVKVATLEKEPEPEPKPEPEPTPETEGE
ncbi:MAG: hypothetical protein J6Q65_07715 [Lentisphaeria bacterium]|nr:hypothetical protein [Lentisphaeria bacterium]